MTEIALKQNRRIGVKEITKIGMLAAIAGLLTIWDFPLWFAPGFYELDFSEVPVLIGAFSMGPLAGILIELIKILVRLFFTGTQTAFVGEFANFLIGVSFILPAALIYKHRKNHKNAIVGMTVGTLAMAIVGGFLNAYVILPVYSKVFMPMDKIIAMGTGVNKAIDGMLSFILLSVVPFNLFKGVVVTIITLLLYKRIRILLK